MKYVWRILFFALILIPVAQVHAESTPERVFANLDLPIAKKDVLKSAPGRQSKKDGMTVELRKRKT